MKGIEWGLLYNTYKDAELDPDALEAAITRLMADDDVSNKKGIYTYILNGDERNLSIRPFSDTQKREAYERQKGICPISTMSLLRCTAIISSLGTQAVRPFRRTCRCCAGIVI